MNKTYRLHFSLVAGDEPDYLLSLKDLSLSVTRQFVNIPIHSSHPSPVRAQFAAREQLIGPGLVNWYVGSLTTSNIDLLAFAFKHLRLLPPPIIFGFDLETLRAFCLGNTASPSLDKMAENLCLLLNDGKDAKDYIFAGFIKKSSADLRKVTAILASNGYLSGSEIAREPKDYFLVLRAVRENLKHKDYRSLGTIFNELTGDVISEENFKENLYLKTLNSNPIVAKDIMPLRAESRNSELIIKNYQEYVDCVDELLSKDAGEIERGLRRVLDEYALSLESLTAADVRKRYSYERGQIRYHDNFLKRERGSFYKHPKTHIICYCNKGIIFKHFPDPIHAARYTDDPIVDRNFSRLWTSLQPSIYERLQQEGYVLSFLDTYKHKKWRFSKREPDFTVLGDDRLASVSTTACESIIYTGKSHIMMGVIFYEIDVVRYKEANVIGNAIRDYVDRLFWDAENTLRARHNLPGIGEGWLSEMRMFRLILNNYPDSIHHYSPDWLRPQHYDVYIPSLGIAIEYQGKQHYEPVGYFGSTDGFQDNIRRDKVKFGKSKKNHVGLIYWRYDESIDYETMKHKLGSARPKPKLRP